MTSPQNSLNKLNEYCIVEIFKHLDKTTQFILSAINKKFCKIFFIVNQSSVILPEYTKNISNEVLEEIFKNIGEKIEKIYIDNVFVLTLASKYCNNLIDLSVEYYNYKMPDLEVRNLANNNEKLKSLTIACQNFDDEQLSYFNDKLEYLSLSDTNVKGDFLKNFKNINTLICSSTSVKFNCFKEFCKECNKNLRALDVRASSISRQEFYTILAKYCPNLEYLAVDSIRVVDKLKKDEYLIPLKSLKHLLSFNVEDFNLPNTLNSLYMFSQYWDLEETEYLFDDIEKMHQLEAIQFAGAHAMGRILWKHIKLPLSLKKIAVEVSPYILGNDDFFTFVKNSSYDLELIYHVDITSRIAENFAARLEISLKQQNVKTNIKIYERMQDYPKEVLISPFSKPFNSFFDMRIQWGY